MRRCLFLLVMAPLAACGSDRPNPPAAAVDPDRVVLGEAGVSLGGEVLAGPPGDALAVLEPLSTRLVDRRAQWKAAHPDDETPGELTLEIGAAVTCRAAMSAYVTAARAGFPRLTLKQGSTTLQVPYFIPQEDSPCETTAGVRELDAVFLANGEVELRLDGCGGAFDATPPPALASMVKELCGARTDCFDGLRIACPAGVPMAAVLGAVAGVKAVHPAMSLGLARSCTAGDPSPFYPVVEAAAAPVPSVVPAGNRPSPAQVRAGAVTVTGGLGAKEVEDALRPKLAEIRACYERELVRNPGLAGRAAATLLVGKRGAVMQARNGGSDLPSGDVVACVIRALRTATFPAKGAMSTVTYPVVLTPR